MVNITEIPIGGFFKWEDFEGRSHTYQSLGKEGNKVDILVAKSEGGLRRGFFMAGTQVTPCPRPDDWPDGQQPKKKVWTEEDLVPGFVYRYRYSTTNTWRYRFVLAAGIVTGEDGWLHNYETVAWLNEEDSDVEIQVLDPHVSDAPSSLTSMHWIPA